MDAEARAKQITERVRAAQLPGMADLLEQDIAAAIREAEQEAAAQATLAERATCAALCEETGDPLDNQLCAEPSGPKADHLCGRVEQCDLLARAIRARGKAGG